MAPPHNINRGDHLRLVDLSTPWTNPRSYEPEKPDLIEQLRRRKPPSYLSQLADDWRDMLSEIRGSPYSHAFVAIVTVILWTALLVAPTLIGGW